ncbi:MAG: (2Fe-2S)-binding protein [Verrucomicrobiales bacterium]|nr:(2Fe-2S)-binding protein [Verrucomicrobiales bacterium]
MNRFTLDGRPVEVAEGKTILDGARLLGVDIPTLCYLERCGPMTSCLVCVVKVTLNGRTSVMPSCAVKVVDGMQVESETPEVHDLRRSALELLLSDHVGDCLSPCARICPLGLNIPQMLRQVQLQRPIEAMATVRASLALPAVLGRLCHKPCENGCRRAACDSAAAIKDVERFVADFGQTLERPCLPPKRASSGKQVAVIGSGPVGLAAAYELVRQGHRCVVFDRRSQAGGSLRREVEAGGIPVEVLERELSDLAAFGIEFRLGIEIGRGQAADLAQLRADFGAVLLAIGELRPGEGEPLQVPLTGAGIKIVRAEAFLTGVEAVFAAGSAVRPIKQLVKAMAEGQAAAVAISEFLAGRESRKARKPFSSLMGRIEVTELKLFQDLAHPGPRVVASNGGARGYSPPEAAEESSRCLHCDCRAAGDCRLQHYSQVYGAEFNRFPRQRRAFEQHHHPARVLFEPGKCILCGICVHLASEAAEPLGLTFVGRGFDVRVSAPLNEVFDQGLQRVAVECAEACPTGAIAIASPTDRLGLGSGAADLNTT